MNSCTDGLYSEEEPPPLEDMSELFRHLRPEEKLPSVVTDSQPLKRTVDKKSLVDESLLPLPCGKAAKQPKIKPLRRGFLNGHFCREKSSLLKRKEEDIPLIKPKSANPKDDNIPEFLRVENPREKFRQEITRLMKPTEELVKDVLNNEVIKNGLEDPEVMFAVQQIASDPDSINKYKNNSKVTHFYSQLGKLMGDKIKEQDGKCT
eukprot:Gb_15403 [translate_table: standard]